MILWVIFHGCFSSWSCFRASSVNIRIVRTIYFFLWQGIYCSWQQFKLTCKQITCQIMWRKTLNNHSLCLRISKVGTEFQCHSDHNSRFVIWICSYLFTNQFALFKISWPYTWHDTCMTSDLVKCYTFDLNNFWHHFEDSKLLKLITILGKNVFWILCSIEWTADYATNNNHAFQTRHWLTRPLYFLAAIFIQQLVLFYDFFLITQW